MLVSVSWFKAWDCVRWVRSWRLPWFRELQKLLYFRLSGSYFFWCVLFWIENHVTVVRTPCFHVLLTTSLPERYIEKSEKIQIWPKIHYSAWHSWRLCTGQSFLMKVLKLITWHTSLRDYWILSMGMYACSLNLDGIF